MLPRDFIIGAFSAALITLAALRVRALHRSGAIAAFVVGTITYGVGGVPFTLTLLGFFVSSTLLSRLGRARKRELVDVGKHGARDGWQVLANGGVATVCAAIVGMTFTQSGATNVGFLAALGFAGAYAAATADTWATEVGTLATRPPRSIISGRPLATGLSGGVSLRGTLAALAGSAFIAVVGSASILLLFFERQTAAAPSIYGTSLYAFSATAGAIFAGGFTGSFADSLLGATLQEQRFCAACARACETNPHWCGAATTLQRGLPGFSNDLVNFAATATGALVAAGSFAVLVALARSVRSPIATG